MKIINKKETSEFLGIPIEEILYFYKFPNGDWKYEDKNRYLHLYRLINNEWIELTKNVEAVHTFSFNNEDWKYEDKEGFEHLFREINGEYVELTKEVDAICSNSCDNGDWDYLDFNHNLYVFNKNNELIRKFES